MSILRHTLIKSLLLSLIPGPPTKPHILSHADFQIVDRDRDHGQYGVGGLKEWE